jgi:hypothetical protein
MWFEMINVWTMLVFFIAIGIGEIYLLLENWKDRREERRKNEAKHETK